MNYNIKTIIKTLENYIPDIAVYNLNLPTYIRPNRVLNNIKLLFK